MIARNGFIEKNGVLTKAPEPYSATGLQGLNSFGVASVPPPTKGITSAAVDGSGDLIITYSDGSTLNAGHVVGADGATGATGNTGAPGLDGTNGTDGLGTGQTSITFVTAVDFVTPGYSTQTISVIIP